MTGADAGPRTHVVGAGLIGASIGIGLRAEGWSVTIEDADPEAESLARSIGAGEALGDVAPALVVGAVPPAIAAQVVVASLERCPDPTAYERAEYLHVLSSWPRQG